MKKRDFVYENKDVLRIGCSHLLLFEDLLNDIKPGLPQPDLFAEGCLDHVLAEDD